MSASSSILLLLAVAVPMLGGIAGLVLFIVGLVRKRPAMWGSGLGLGLGSIVILFVAMGFAMFTGLRSTRVATRAVRRQALVAAQQAASAPTTVGGLLQQFTGQALPASVSASRVVSSSAASTDGNVTFYGARLAVPRNFGNYLGEPFREAEWDDADVQAAVRHEEAARAAFLKPADLRSMTCHTLARPDPADASARLLTVVFHRVGGTGAYVICVRQAGGGR